MLRCPAVWLLLLVDLRNTVPHLLPHTPATPTFLRLDFIYPMCVPWSRDALPEGQVWLRGWRFPCSGSFLQLICCRTVTLHGLLRIRFLQDRCRSCFSQEPAPERLCGASAENQSRDQSSTSPGLCWYRRARHHGCVIFQ